MALELVAVDKRFRSQRALERVSLRVGPGEIVAFLGHNGAGKTTAMRVALGLVRPDAGSVHVDGFDAARFPSEARARLGGLVEQAGFHGAWSAREELESLARVAGLEPGAARAAAERALTRVGLDPTLDKPVRAYSQGMRQRFGLALALLAEPRYLLLDEPLNGLDPEGVVELRKLLHKLAHEDGVGILVSSHQLAELSSLATHAVILRQGRVVRAAPMRELATGASVRLIARDPAAARAALAARGLRVEAQGDELAIETGDLAVDELARLVLAHGGFASFVERAPTLEEIYLRARDAQAADEPAAAPAPAVASGVPAQRLARRGAMLRAGAYELARVTREGRPLVWAALLSAVAGLALVQRLSGARRAAAEVAGGEVFSATAFNAFEAVAVLLSAALALLVFVVVGLASQSLAGEQARGTLRNLLLRPLGRGELVFGKAWALAGGVLLGYLALAAAALGVSGLVARFDGVTETLPNGTAFPLVAAAELWPELAWALLSPLLPLCSAVALGFLAGAVAQTGAAALALALGSWVGLDLLRVFARGHALEAWLPGAYLPGPLSDTSALAYYAELASGVSSARFDFAGTSVLVPLAWSILCLVAARAILVRRDVS